MNRTANVLVFMVFVFAGTIGWSATENTGSTVEKGLFDDDFESVAPGAPIRAKVGQWRGFGPLGARVTDEGAAGPASENSQRWFVMDRADDGRSQAWLADDLPAAETADKIVATFSTHCDSESKQITRRLAAYQFGLGTTLGGVLQVQESCGGSGTFWAAGSEGPLDTKVPYKAGAWPQQGKQELSSLRWHTAPTQPGRPRGARPLRTSTPR